MRKSHLLFFISWFLFFSVTAQNKQLEPWQYGHWLSPDEMLHKDLIGKNFQETPPPAGAVRNVAEFDKMQGVLVRYPFGIPVELVREMAVDVMVTTIVLNSSQQSTVYSQYQAAGVNMSHCNFLLAPSDSYWTRDYGPWFESDSSNHIGIIDFPYNRPRPNDDEIPKKVADMLGIQWYGMNVIHTGGNYMTDGMGISSSTTLVWDENPTQTHDSIAQKVHDYLGIDPYLVVQDPNGTYINHIDCWGKYLAPDKILIRRVPTSHPQYAELEATAAYYSSTPCSYGYNYRVFRVYTPNDEPYSNSLILNTKVFIPFMNTTLDDSAVAAYQAAMPGYQVIGIIGNSSTPWVSTDALHCRTMGIADLGQLYIRHIPLTGNQPAQDNFMLTADLLNCSDSAVYADSVLIWYQVNNSAYYLSHMINTSANHWLGYIPKQPSGSVIRYYLYAADRSGQNSTMPIMGPADPFTFTAIYTDLTAIPDTLWFRTIADCINGKTTYLHNYSSAGINLTSVQSSGLPIWWVDSMSVNTFPHMMATGDSVYIHVVVTIATSSSIPGYYLDSLIFTSELNSHRVILAINESVLSGINQQNGQTNAILGSAYPNPFTEKTTIPFTLTAATLVQLDIFDAQGRNVRNLYKGRMEAIRHEIVWNGKDETGQIIPAGVYFYRLKTDGTILTKRVVLIR